MHKRFVQIAFLTIGLAAGFRSEADAGDCCAHCGCACSCQKTCRLVCDEKKVEIICWGCKCQDFCLPKPSCPGCRHCEEVCGTCGEIYDGETPYAKPKTFVWFDWTPGCAKVYTKKLLMQKKITKSVPSYKWVVEDLCPKCEASCAYAELKPGVDIPPPPVADAKLILGQRSVPVQRAP
jgi:hypothetical protein